MFKRRRRARTREENNLICSYHYSYTPISLYTEFQPPSINETKSFYLKCPHQNQNTTFRHDHVIVAVCITRLCSLKGCLESSEESVREFLEVSEEHNKDKHIQNRTREKDVNVSSLSKDSTAADDCVSDHFSEIDTNEQVGNIGTLIDDENPEYKYDKVITFAPGEGQHPHDAEYLCFPSIFCGERRPFKDDRTVLVNYSDIVNWELRSVGRRAAQSVPNIFFKHKKYK